MMFLITLMIGSLISISSNTWMGMWLGLEINLLSIIPLMNNNSIYSSEASMKYFITQTMASTLIMFAIISMFLNMKFIDNKMIIMNSALMIKIGSAPFHFWFPEIMEGLNWMNCLLLLTWQKLAPMIILMYNLILPSFLIMIIMMNMLIGSIMGLNQISLRKIMAFSSINHIGWMLASMMFFNSIWTNYYIIYILISITMTSMFMMFNIFFIKQIFMKIKNNSIFKLLFSMNLLSLGGMPPFIGFMPKWLVIQSLINNKMLMMTLIMMMITLITLFYYTRIMFSMMLINKNQLNYYYSINLNYNFMIFMNLISIFGLILVNLMFNLL
uniref:NADH-ubiquinone oxidoreductase chain 2 n=1 Tax=Staphylinidae sp. BMNH 1274705 TaxID=1796598 RepID=A0A126TG65_9COLE|nr:NADH dehydrogenase subunit 2 [Staphylinidae sp. BMNH 1274705]